MSLRIAMVTEAWAPWVDGMVTRLERTVECLREAGHEVLVIAPTTGTTVAGVHEQKTRSVRLGFLYGGRPWGVPDRVVLRALRTFRPDVVHVVNPIFMGAVAARWVQGRYPLVVSYHTDVLAYAQHYRLGWLRPLIRAVMRSAYRPAQLRLATSQVGRAQLLALGVGDVELWRRAVDASLFRRDRDGQRLRSRLGPDPRLPVALYVGRLAAEKGCGQLRDMVDGHPCVQLAFVGDGPDAGRLRRLFRGTRTTFTGVLRGDDLADAYAAADALVFPSTSDTLGLVLLEAIASGLPVVALDTPTARETLAGYPAAALVPEGAPGNAWCEAVHSMRGLTRPRSAPPVPGWQEATELLLGGYRQAVERFHSRRRPR